MPRWPYIKIPIKEFEKANSLIINKLIDSREFARLHSFITALSMDVWWVYTYDDDISLSFYTTIFLRTLSNFLIAFPDVRSLINSPLPIGSFFGADEKLLIENPSEIALDTYLSHVLICVVLNDVPETHTDLARANQIASTFVCAYNDTLTRFLIKYSTLLPSSLSIFSFCFVFMWTDAVNIRRQISELNGGVDDQFLRRFSDDSNITYWSPELGYFKNVAGNWQIRKPIIATPREVELLRRYEASKNIVISLRRINWKKKGYKP